MFLWVYCLFGLHLFTSVAMMKIGEKIQVNPEQKLKMPNLLRSKGDRRSLSQIKKHKNNIFTNCVSWSTLQ